MMNLIFYEILFPGAPLPLCRGPPGPPRGCPAGPLAPRGGPLGPCPLGALGPRGVGLPRSGYTAEPKENMSLNIT